MPNEPTTPERAQNAPQSILEALAHWGETMANGGYPSPEQILAAEETYDPQLVSTVMSWKTDVWAPARKHGPEGEFLAIKALIERLATDADNALTDVQWEPEGHSRYRAGVVYIGGRPSIITGLHELSHHLHGSSEHKACSWSIHLFKKCFERAYNKLEWNGHLLVRKPEEEAEKEAVTG